MSAPASPLVLLVEDSELVRDAFTLLLEDSGYRVAGAADGAEALRVAVQTQPDLALVDLGLPGLDGVQVIHALRGIPSLQAIPILALTGRDDPETRRACDRAGCQAFLVKPLPTQLLLRAVAEHLAAARQG